MKEFIEFIAKHLVDKPEEVVVKEVVGETGDDLRTAGWRW
jgi:predicted RNA-binding protein YlqC (UPF0109 family)